MKAYVSLHTAKPQSQIDQEVSYEGYHRLEVEFGENFAHEPLTLIFPIVKKDSSDVATYIAIGACEKGQGEIFMRVPALPNIVFKTEPERKTVEWWMKHGMTKEQAERAIIDHGDIAPRVCICNTSPVKLPGNLNPIARVAHQLVYSGLIKTEELHPKLFEAINDALHNAGVPVLKVSREGTAKMEQSLEKLTLSGVAGHA